MTCELVPCGNEAHARLTFGSDRVPPQSCNVCRQHLEDFWERSKGAVQQNLMWASLAAPRQPEET